MLRMAKIVNKSTLLRFKLGKVKHFVKKNIIIYTKSDN
jgi:hypothetical protein